MTSDPSMSLPGGVTTIERAVDNALDVSVVHRGARHSVRDVGSGHSPHTITEKGGRVATDTEIALAKALAALQVSDRDLEAARQVADGELERVREAALRVKDQRHALAVENERLRAALEELRAAGRAYFDAPADSHEAFQAAMRLRAALSTDSEGESG